MHMVLYMIVHISRHTIIMRTMLMISHHMHINMYAVMPIIMQINHSSKIQKKQKVLQRPYISEATIKNASPLAVPAMVQRGLDTMQQNSLAWRSNMQTIQKHNSRLLKKAPDQTPSCKPLASV